MATNIDHNLRAFLSYATVDDRFLTFVAARLGRQRVRLDKQEFVAGDEFAEAIQGALAASRVFVLFVSKASLDSLWVRFEVGEAERLLRAEILRKTLAIIIDPHITHHDLPRWMQRSLVQHASTPAAAARLVDYHLNRARGITSGTIFVGRDALLAELADKLIPQSDEPPPHIVLAGGLPGVGRRTLMKRALSDFLSIQLTATFHVRQTDGLDALHLQLLDELGELDTRTQLENAIAQYQAGTMSERATTVVELLYSVSSNNTAPLIVDDGGMLDPSGAYTAEADALMKQLSSRPDLIVAIVHTRRPNISPVDLRALRAVYVRVPPLDSIATKQLLTRKLRDASINADMAAIEELAPYLNGYPPVVDISVGYIRDRGLALALADKASLVNFQSLTFADILNKLALNDIEWRLLRYLSAGLNMPMEGLDALFGVPSTAITVALNRLIDLNLVIPGEATYGIANPIRFAVQALKGLLSKDEYAGISTSLQAHFWKEADYLPSLEIIDTTINALLRSGGEVGSFKSILIPSTLFRSAKALHDQRGHESLNRAKRLLLQLLDLEPTHRAGLALLCKIQARLMDWTAAEKTLGTIRELNYVEHFFLAGFILWKKRRFPDAIVAFRTAIAKHQRSVEVYHGLATCLFRLGKYDEAKAAIDERTANRGSNNRLVDLAAQIAIARKDYPEAERQIDNLKRLNATEDYHHRLATLLNARGRHLEALPHAEKSVGDFSRRFEAETVLADTLIEIRRFDDALAELAKLEQMDRFEADRKDIVLGLKCKLWLRKGDWRQAEALWELLQDRDQAVHQGLRHDILSKKIQDPAVSPGQKADARNELASMADSDHGHALSVFLLGDEADSDQTEDIEQVSATQ